MIDLELARTAVEQRKETEMAALIQDEGARQEHARMMAQTSAAIISGQQRSREAKAAAHALARTAAREAMDALAALRAVRESSEEKVGHMRGDLEQATKRATRCVAPHPDSYPTDEEISAWKGEWAELNEAVRSISARIFAETSQFDFAQRQEWEAQSIFEQAARVEWERRSDL